MFWLSTAEWTTKFFKVLVRLKPTCTNWSPIQHSRLFDHFYLTHRYPWTCYLIYKCCVHDLFNPNLPNFVNFVPFGMMRYIKFLPSTLYVLEHNLHDINCIICLFLNKVLTFLFPMICDLLWFTIILMCYQIHNYFNLLSDSYCQHWNPQNGVGKLGLTAKLMAKLPAISPSLYSLGGFKYAVKLPI